MAILVRDATGVQQTQQLSSIDASYGFTFTATSPGTTAATDVLVLQGASGIVTRLKRLKISYVSSATAGFVGVTLVRQSAATTTTVGSIVAVALDSGAPAAGTGVLKPNANGTAVNSNVQFTDYLDVAAATTGISSLDIKVSDWLGEPFILRGTSDFLAVNLTEIAAQSGVLMHVAGIFDEGTN